MHILYSTSEHVSYFGWDDFVVNLDTLLQRRGVPAIVVGTIQRWNGKFAGGCLLHQAKDILAFLKDCETIVIYEDDEGRMMLRASHHDGTNTAEVRLLTDEGAVWYDENFVDTMSKRELFESLFTGNLFSVPLRLSDFILGMTREEVFV